MRRASPLQGQKRAVKSLTAGDVFGEVALLTKAPRQADCVAATRRGGGGAAGAWPCPLPLQTGLLELVECPLAC